MWLLAAVAKTVRMSILKWNFAGLNDEIWREIVFLRSDSAAKPLHTAHTAHSILRQKHFLHWSLSLSASFMLLGWFLFFSLCRCFCPSCVVSHLWLQQCWNGTERKVRLKWFYWFNSFHFSGEKKREKMKWKKEKWRGSDRMCREKSTKYSPFCTPSEREIQKLTGEFFQF